MIQTNEFILSGRYRILGSLGQGTDGTVYLARHQSLEVERAIKVFPKESALSLFTLSEANVLKSLQHPGIPTIYDLEEDESHIYLVEEYIRGESLEHFLLHQQFISQNLFIQFCEQLCSIFAYLHSLRPNPILYQDLKPEHIIVCGLQIKLIDFSVSSFFSLSGNNFKCFGNTAFSAPELFADEPVTLASDIYSLGKVMEFMAGFLNRTLPQNILSIIKKATNTNPACRFETVDELAQALEKSNAPTVDTTRRQTIAVIGSHSGCGTTHIAISLSCALNSLGQHTLYVERNATDCLRKAIPHLPKAWEQNGYYYCGCFIGLPQYGEGIQIRELPFETVIVDYGIHFPQDLICADRILFICGGGPWHTEDANAIARLPENLKKRLTIIANLCERESAVKLAKMIRAPIYHYPFNPNPFKNNGISREFVHWLFPQKGGGQAFFRIKNLFSRKREP